MLDNRHQKNFQIESTVVNALKGGEKESRELRQLVLVALAEKGMGGITRVDFFEHMAQMEERGVVTHDERARSEGGRSESAQWYQLTGGGKRLIEPEDSSHRALGDVLGGLLRPRRPGLQG